MTRTWLLMALAALIPIVAAVVVWAGSAEISERHHSHHDTYKVASNFSWGIVFAIILLGALGVLLAWLCVLGVFEADPMVVLAFFDTCLVLTFAGWVMLRRYKVVTFEDRMLVTPFVGPSVTIRYAEISAMEWISSVMVPHGRNVGVFVGHRRRALLWAVLDLDQILMRVDRFDVLQNLIS